MDQKSSFTNRSFPRRSLMFMIRRILACQVITIVAAAAAFYIMMLITGNELLWAYIASGCLVGGISEFANNRSFRHRKELGSAIRAASSVGIALATATASTWWPLLTIIAVVIMGIGGYFSYRVSRLSPMYRQQKPISVVQAITAFLAQILITFVLIHWII
jgi:hypothetical protein